MAVIINQLDHNSKNGLINAKSSLRSSCSIDPVSTWHSRLAYALSLSDIKARLQSGSLALPKFSGVDAWCVLKQSVDETSMTV